MQTVQQFTEGFAVVEADYNSGVIFYSEDKIAENIGANEWVNPCGHDCCTCDAECK